MRRVAWRPVLLTICALAALAQVAVVLDATGIGGAPSWQGWWGANTGASSKPFNLAVTSVDRGGPAARAGLRRGDLIDIRPNTLIERYFLFAVPFNGRAFNLSVHSDSLQKEITIIPRAPVLTWSFWLFTFASLWLLLFASLIAWRGADLPQMRLLSLWIATFVFTGALIGFATPWAWAYVLQNISASVVGPLSVALLAAFASGFAQPLSRPRRITQWLCYTFLAIFTAISLVGTAGVITLRFDPLPLVEGNAGLVSVAVAVLMAALCGLLAIAASRGIERQRAVWTLVPLAAYFCFFILGLIATASSSYSDTIFLGLVSTLVLLTAPVALTYAALSRRLIDVGFFLNRAAVFTIVSAIVIGAFILAEWAAGAWLASTTHTASVFIGMVVALGLGISLRYIHGYVEGFVDRVFFSKRHEAESALRRFAHEASYISDRATLLDRAVQTVKEHTTATDAAILVRDGVATYAFAGDGQGAEVSENDPGIIALRAWNKPIDLQAFPDSQLRGEFAFPMISRGDLLGALICGRKRDGEAYAPDESEALLALAHGVGTALDTLSSQSNGVLESIRETQALMLQELQKLPRAIESALRERGEKG
ncbi:MAG TPA: GAF domain-containing protein [Candidatus Acidoferrales bacterium]|nr:GAF domain-containing protein [Candidatus Acidoferrales bacterium]